MHYGITKMWTLRASRIALSAPSLSEWLRWLARLAAPAQQRSRQRRALARLDARLLRDVGLNPDQARREAAKPFWRA